MIKPGGKLVILCVLMSVCVLAVGYCRVQYIKYRKAEMAEALNDAELKHDATYPSYDFIKSEAYDGGTYRMITSNTTTTWDFNTFNFSRDKVKRIRKTKDYYIVEMKPGWNKQTLEVK